MTPPARIPARPRSGRRGPTGPVAAVAAAALALLVLSGCAPVTDVRGNWHLVAGSDASGDLDVDGTLITMLLDGDAFTGRGPCNSYSGTWDGEQGPGMMSAFTAATVRCDDGGVEARYFQDLKDASAMRVEDGHLVATGPDGVRLEFEERSRK